MRAGLDLFQECRVGLCSRSIKVVNHVEGMTKKSHMVFRNVGKNSRIQFTPVLIRVSGFCVL